MKLYHHHTWQLRWIPFHMMMISVWILKPIVETRLSFSFFFFYSILDYFACVEPKLFNVCKYCTGEAIHFLFSKYGKNTMQIYILCCVSFHHINNSEFISCNLVFVFFFFLLSPLLCRVMPRLLCVWLCGYVVPV